MKTTFLGQAGLLFRENGTTVMIDPYLSDSVGRMDPNKKRNVPVDTRFFSLKPDVLVITHEHLDHYDPETVARYVTADSQVTVLSPFSVWQKIRAIGGKNNYVLFDAGTMWSEHGFTFSAVPAVHSDPYAIGVVIDNGTHKYYVTGDTLYSHRIFAHVPPDVYALFLPINGAGNNMNRQDAARFAEKIRARVVVPMHFGLLDRLDAEDFSCDNKRILDVYKEEEL